MAATIRPVWYHVFYSAGPDAEGKDRPPHILSRGPDCWCEPKAMLLAPGVVLVIHDPEDTIILHAHRPRMDGL